MCQDLRCGCVRDCVFVYDRMHIVLIISGHSPLPVRTVTEKWHQTYNYHQSVGFTFVFPTTHLIPSWQNAGSERLCIESVPSLLPEVSPERLSHPWKTYRCAWMHLCKCVCVCCALVPVGALSAGGWLLLWGAVLINPLACITSSSLWGVPSVPVFSAEHTLWLMPISWVYPLQSAVSGQICQLTTID